MTQHLEEVLAGDDKGQLSAEVVWLGLATSHALHQLRDVVGNGLDTPEHRAKGYSLPNIGYSLQNVVHFTKHYYGGMVTLLLW